MKIKDYFKKTLENLFLHTKHMSKGQYQAILDEYCQGVAKCIGESVFGADKKVIIAFGFEDEEFEYAMTIAEGKYFEKVISIDYIEKE
jgi:hypothetical protein